MEKNSSTDIPVQRERKSGFGALGVALALLLAIGTFASGVQIGSGNEGRSQSANLYNFFFPEPVTTVSQEPDLSEFWRVWDLLEEKYVAASSTQVVTVEDRIQGAIDGLVDTYEDPYTVYLPPVEASQFGDDVSGEFSGVGMEVGLRDGVITVIAPLPETPADRAGLLPGDLITRIDDRSTENMRVDEAVTLIRGERGTTVNLTVFRSGELDFLTIPVVRDTIEIPTVKTAVEGDTFVISLYSFNAISEDRVRDAVREFVASGQQKLILDVRGNPGGFLQSAVSIASYFLPSGKVVVTQESGVEREVREFRSRNRNAISQFSPDNLVVLVDGGSASASEILAGALQDHEVATVIGAQTFGKGSVQELVDLADGSSLKVTVARWLTPNGTSISDGGLTPDIVINRTPQERVDGADPQLEAALRFLSGETVVSEDFEQQLTAADDSATTTEVEVGAEE